MDYEQKHPILQKLDEYFKNTPKEQIDKDWSDILKETDSEAYYEKKYKETLERIKELLDRAKKQGHIIVRVEDIENIFPELQEGEEEKIRKEIINVFKQLDEGTTICGRNYDYAKWVAWLEKQCEFGPKFKVGDWCIDNEDNTIFKIVKVLDHTYTYRTNEGKEYSCTHYSLENDARLWAIQDAKDGDVLVHIDDFIFIYNNTSILQAYCYYSSERNRFIIEDRGHHCPWNMQEVTPATKEQRELFFSKMKEDGYEWDSVTKEAKRNVKFKVGDWITNGRYNRLVVGVDSKHYQFKNGDAKYINDIDKKYHLWTIQDAKCGDVLISSYKQPFMYNGNYFCNELVGDTIGAYFGLTIPGELLICDSHGDNWTDLIGVQPATEEQRNILFKKLHDSDYKWDSEKKELWHKYL